ncbi:hypothetical protein CBS101457_003652 [Exobasidium rhododendri]|nr:hypothetical protein CBS101457_003652 [Exobasidium rhododendri]
MATSFNSPYQHTSIRNAIQDEKYHIVRVNEEGTGEIYDLNLSNSTPYASPVTTNRERAYADSQFGAIKEATTGKRQHVSSSSANGSGGVASGSDERSNNHSSSSHGRRILQLPQIVSRRNGHQPSSSAQAKGSNPLQPPLEMKNLAMHQDAIMRMEPGSQLQTIVGELPPSPPLEPEYRNGLQNGNMFDTAISKSSSRVDETAMTTGRIRSRPRRALTNDDRAYSIQGDETRPSRSARAASGASTASTTYLSASSSQDDNEDSTDTYRQQMSKFSIAPFVAEPASLLHPSSAQDTEASNALSRRPSPSLSFSSANSASRRPLPSRRNTTGGSSQKKRAGSEGSINTQRSRKNSKDRDGPPTSFYNEQSSGPSAPFHASSVVAPPLQTGDAGLDEAIAKQADQMRRQRETKKMREMTGEVEPSENTLRGGATLTRARSGRKLTEEEPKALMGNVIDEGHANYVLMYNMLTGIRIGVSRCQAKIKRTLTDADYSARHKFTFDIIGNELTPSAKYDFKFKDYAPWVFRELREYFHLDPADYLLSLTSKYILSELGSPGKSGSFFYFSRDYRFIIKTIRHNEHKFLIKILKEYHLHIKSNPHTLLSRFYGLHRVKLPGGKKIHFVIMNNIFPPHRDIHETYDLKGSAIGREYPEEKAAQKKGAVLKDLNWVKRGRELQLGPDKLALFEAQIRSDVALLQKLGIMDYSLLIGLHDMKRGNKEGLRQDALQIIQPVSKNPSHPGHITLKREPTVRLEKEAYALRSAVRRSDAKTLGSTAATKLPEHEGSERLDFLFYQDEGGYRATDMENKPTDWIYYFGIIDTLTSYNSIKRGEHFFKSLTHNSHMISSISPVPYGKRFCNFLFSIVKGADQSQRPRML